MVSWTACDVDGEEDGVIVVGELDDAAPTGARVLPHPARLIVPSISTAMRVVVDRYLRAA